MNWHLKIAVADDEADMREFYQHMLPQLGHQVKVVASTGAELIQACGTSAPDLIITDIRMSDMDGFEAVARICAENPVPVIVVSAYQDDSLLARAQADHIMGYLVKPIDQADLAPAIAVAMSRFDQFQTLRKEASDLRQALADRKVIERAKGIIMKVSNIDEQEAFRRLQKMANDRNKKVVEIAEMVVTAELLVRPGRPS